MGMGIILEAWEGSRAEKRRRGCFSGKPLPGGLHSESKVGGHTAAVVS